MKKALFNSLFLFTLLVLVSCAPQLKEGDSISQKVNSQAFVMVFAGSGTFPFGRTAEATVFHPFWIAQTEVSLALWKEVYDWATSVERGEARYTFANEGKPGSHPTESSPQHPVTMINWRDALIWTNALNEMLGLVPVYHSNANLLSPLRDSTGGEYKFLVNEEPGSIDNPFVHPKSNGYRLPSSVEFERAARWKGLDSANGALEHPLGSGLFWTPPLYVSGAKDVYTNGRAVADVAWFRESSNQGSGMQAQPIAQLIPNDLGLFDVSGNVWEWCFDWTLGGENLARTTRGGGWKSEALSLVVTEISGLTPFSLYDFQGFRLARSEW